MSAEFGPLQLPVSRPLEGARLRVETPPSNVQEFLFGNNYRLFAAEQEMIKYAIGAHRSLGADMTDHRAFGPDGTMFTKQGLAYQLSNSEVPTIQAIVSPWGRQQIGGVIREIPEKSMREITRKIMDDVDPLRPGEKRKPIQGLTTTSYGKEGPIYAVRRIGSLSLPNPVLEGPLDNLERYSRAQEWDEFNKRLKREQGSH